MKIPLLFLLLVVCLHVDAWKFCHKGRLHGGNLGEPGSRGTLSRSPFVKTLWFKQWLDHFNPRNEETWQQRYFINNEYYQDGGPIFLMIGGEAEASDKWMTQGAWVDYAKKFKALLFQVEHRFYGQSHPTEDISVKNLVYLSSEQALADLATFITKMTDELKLTGKWIAFGGSYPGSLAAWLRMKYPHLIHGAVSSSGPLLAEVDFFDYFRVVDEALESYSEQCLANVKTAHEQVNLLTRHPLGMRKLDESFKLCDPLQTLIKEQKHLSNFWDTLANNFAGVVQYNKDNRIGKTKAGNITIDDLCGIMLNETIGIPVQRLAAINTLLLNATNQTCLDYNYDNMINELRNTSWEGEGARQWTYQTCTEFGFYQTSSYSPHVFGDQFPVDFYIQQCEDIFGSRFNTSFLDRAVDRTNTIYGGLDIDVTNVVFVHGSVDPWHALGITKTKDQGAPAIYIEGTAHCANMYPRDDSDPPQLNQARVEIENHIDSWLRL
ncbi:putative serine protease K12H4.7 [Coccinella septempunctata]|uniref:putative serine protease K12H4.7 n=1 Tax=Coccinella septempunctata TaxID=41139 RepID=UPI001D07E369|nr:putative serine protease K12H4.7 [Coccinella septempunctata]XP_044750413.1 putative serine protease K12H4.7 [Coccinella septempunctata]XP_044750421.1 putative serine protease K12H4.7 [Coccinella septempunctata]XP_044750428.1 putative serine protease K12H4.7 [Coccinella septempunctata]